MNHYRYSNIFSWAIQSCFVTKISLISLFVIVALERKRERQNDVRAEIYMYVEIYNNKR